MVVPSTNDKPHILLVTYGGGHIKMVLPVLRECQRRGFKISILGLTLAGPVLQAEKIQYYSFHDFVKKTDQSALHKGEQLARAIHNHQAGVPWGETIAYLGLSYMDLVERLGELKAEQEFSEKGRHAFLPLTILERVFDRLQPDLLVTTNSPRAEQAAVMIANKRNIPSVSMVDLFGIKEMYPLCADRICVLSEISKQNLIEKNGIAAEKIIVTGNPAFDNIFRLGDIDDEVNKLSQQLDIDSNEKCLLWIDQPSCWLLNKNKHHIFRDSEIAENLMNLYHVARKLELKLLIRPHPSQNQFYFESMVKQYPTDQVKLTSNLPLYPLLKLADVVVTRTSTVSLEALLLQKALVILEEEDEITDMPLVQYGLALGAKNPQELCHHVQALLKNKSLHKKINGHVLKFFNKTCAANAVVECIEQLWAKRKSLTLNKNVLTSV